MKLRIQSLGSLSAILLLFSSCLGEGSDDRVTYNDAAIIGFSIQTLNRLMHGKSKKGEDSTYIAKFTATNYPFYIDQIRHEIYNPDSLPVGVDATKVLATITPKNGGVLALKSLKSDSVKYFNAKDSIDFSQPRQLVVYNQAGTAKVNYTVRVNVHREKPNDFKWICLQRQNQQLANLTSMKALVCKGKVYVFGEANDETKIFATSIDEGRNWQEVKPLKPLSSEAYSHVVVMNNKFYTYQEGIVLCSDNGVRWQYVGKKRLKQLLGACGSTLYAIDANQRIVASGDEGATWQEELMSDAKELLPLGDYNFVVQPLRTNKDTYRLILIGKGKQTTVLWSKIEDKNKKGLQQSWTFYPSVADNLSVLPNLENLQVVKNAEALVAIGGEGIYQNKKIKAFNTIYNSIDGGVTWGTYGNIRFPKEFKSSNTAFALTVDTHHYLWIICGKTGQVWKGRLNKLGWKKVEKEFNE